MAFIHSVKNRFLNWARPFLQLPVVGIDISDRSMKYIRFNTRGGSSVFTHGEIEIPAGIIVSGDIQKEDELTKILSTWFRNEKKLLKTRFVAASLPEEKSFLRVIQLPLMEKSKIKNAIRWELETNIPLPAENLSYDYEVIEPFIEGLDHIDAVVVAFPRTTVESYIRVLKQAGMQPVALDLESQAITRTVVPSFGVHANTIVVDMGRMRTSFILFMGNAIMFTSTIEVGGIHIEQAITQALGVDAKKAIEIKKEAGLRKDVREGRVFEALSPLLNQLVWKLRTAMDYYHKYIKHRHGASDAISNIVLSGGDANLIGLDTYLAASLKTPVLLADPFVSLPHTRQSPPPMPKNQSLAYTTAIGLALRNIREVNKQ